MTKFWEPMKRGACPECGSTEFVPQWREGYPAGTTDEQKRMWKRPPLMLPVHDPDPIECANCHAHIAARRILPA
jgi:hypothetical protein